MARENAGQGDSRRANTGRNRKDDERGRSDIDVPTSLAGWIGRNDAAGLPVSAMSSSLANS